MTEIAGYDLESQMPYYLTKEAKEGISKALKDFPNNINYYLSNTQADNQYLQGDGWSGLIVLDVDTLKKKEVKGIILRNLCTTPQIIAEQRTISNYPISFFIIRNKKAVCCLIYP